MGAALEILLQPREGRAGGDGGADLRFTDFEAGANRTLERSCAGGRRLAEERLQCGERPGRRLSGSGKFQAQKYLRPFDEDERGVIEARQPGSGGALQSGRCFFTNSGSRRDISAIVRHCAGAT